jgi:dipeptidyl aminopeptidase/acylaminoacyl peptidase
LARLTALLAAALLAIAAGSEAADAPIGTGLVVFSAFSGLPAFQGDERCKGLYAAHPDRSGLTRLSAPDTATFEGHYWPSFAPGGGLLSFGVFARRDARDVTTLLFALDAGTGQTRALGRSDFPHPAVWSPRGDAVLVYRARAGRLQLSRVDVRTGRVRDLVGGGFPLTTIAPSWSPDGSRIALAARGRATRTIWVMRADGSRKRRLGPRGATDPTWSPDGSRIAFFRSVGGRTELWTIRPDGRGARRLARGVLDRGRHSLIWSAGGGSLLFLREPPEREYYPGSEYEVGDLYRLQLATLRARLLTRKVIPVSSARDGDLLILRPRTVSGELVFAVVVRSGVRERVVGVTDEEDVNIGSYPAWQPRRTTVRPAVAPFAPRPEWGFCLDRLRGLRADLGG